MYCSVTKCINKILYDLESQKEVVKISRNKNTNNILHQYLHIITVKFEQDIMDCLQAVWKIMGADFC